MSEKIKLVIIISHLNLGGAQTLVYDILINLKKKNDLKISVITIDSGKFTKEFEQAGVEVIDIKEKGLFNFKIYFKLKNILKGLKPDIVHTHLNKADFYGRIAARKTRVPLIYTTCHNYSSHHKGANIDKRSIFDLIDNFVIGYSKSNIIAISEIVKKYLLNRNKDFENILEIIYNGVNTEKENYRLDDQGIISLRNKYSITKEDFVISILGRLEVQKGHKFFLESVKNFLKEKKNIKILILGDGNLKYDIEKIIKDNELQDYVKLLGFQTDTEKYIEISDLICVPSLWEGFGLVIIEGMIKKKPVLASDVGGIAEIIDDGKTGFLFDVNNPASLLEKLTYIYENYKDLNSIKASAFDMVKKKFDIQKNSELYYKSYLKKLKDLRATNL